MARNTKQSKRPAPRPQSSDARRLGAQNNPQMSASAQRRYERRHGTQSRRIGWLAVGAVVLVIAGFLVYKLTGSSSPSAASGVASGQAPALASAAMVDPVTTVPASVFDEIGVSNQPAAFTVTKNQPPLTENGKARFVYYGAEYCPYCAAMRWSVVAALSRFGTFTNLKATTSSSSDIYPNIPTFSFLGSTYSSPYVTFSPYEYLDRNQNPLQSVPTDVNNLYSKYDGTGSTASKFNPGGSPGIPFLDISNKFVSSGDPGAIGQIAQNLSGGGPGNAAYIASLLHNPTSTTAKAIDAQYWISQANYISAAICASNGGKPASVCNSAGVKAATHALDAVKPIG